MGSSPRNSSVSAVRISTGEPDGRPQGSPPGNWVGTLGEPDGRPQGSPPRIHSTPAPTIRRKYAREAGASSVYRRGERGEDVGGGPSWSPVRFSVGGRPSWSPVRFSVEEGPLWSPVRFCSHPNTGWRPSW